MIPSDLEPVDFEATVERMKILRDTHTEEREKEDAAATEEIRYEILKSWGVPLRVRDDLRTIEAREAIIQVKQWLKGPREAWCLVLSGTVGTGKSTAAGWWLYRATRDEKLVPNPRQRWWTAAQLMRADGFDGTIEKVIGVAELVLDDIGAEYSDIRGALRTKVDSIVDERYGNFRRTLICTNLNAEAFRERYGERVLDRINEATKYGGGFWERDAPSMRGK